MASVDPESQLPWMNQLTPTEKVYYHNLFLQADTDKDQYISQNEAVVFLRKSGITDQYLAEIWNFVNRNGRGRLNANAFAVTLRLVSLAQSGKAPTLMNLANTNEYPLPRFEGVEVPMASPPVTPVRGASGVAHAIPVPTSPPRTASTPSQLKPEDPSTWEITPQLRDQYLQSFRGIKQSRPGFISGEESRVFFGQSGLSPNDLSQIWVLSDLDKDLTALSFDEFCIAMFLVNLRIHSKVPLPTSIPPGLTKHAQASLMQSGIPSHLASGAGGPSVLASGAGRPSVLVSGAGVNPVMASAPGVATNPMASGLGTKPNWWTMTLEERQEYGRIFLQLDPQRTGSIAGDVARNAFVQSGLSNEVLSQIWVLADIDKDMKLNSIEFCIAMIFITAAKKGMPVPPTLPIGMIDHIRNPPQMAPPPVAPTGAQLGFNLPKAPRRQQQSMGGAGVIPQPSAPPRNPQHHTTPAPSVTSPHLKSNPGVQPTSSHLKSNPGLQLPPVQPLPAHLISGSGMQPLTNPSPVSSVPGITISSTIMTNSTGTVSQNNTSMILEEQRRRHALMLQAQSQALAAQEKELQEKQQLQAMKTTLLELIQHQVALIIKIKDGQKLNITLATKLFEVHQRIERIKKVGLELLPAREFFLERERMIDEKLVLATTNAEAAVVRRNKLEQAVNEEHRQYHQTQNQMLAAKHEKNNQLAITEKLKQETEKLKKELVQQQQRKERFLVHQAQMREKAAAEKLAADQAKKEQAWQTWHAARTAKHQREDAVISTLLRGQPMPVIPLEYDITSLFPKNNPAEGFHPFSEPLFK